MNNKISILRLLIVGLLAPASSLSFAENGLSEAITFEPALRYRYQQVDDSVRGDAIANTLKLRLSTNWQVNDNINAFIQGDHVHGFSEERYNSITVTRATSPIQEALGTELNQAWLQYTSDNNWGLTIGRQLLGFDNERHVSGVEFWQNDQTFDAITLTYNDSMQWAVTYSYVDKVHRIFGDEAKPILPSEDIRFNENPNRPFLELGNHKHNSHLLNISYQVNRYIGVTSYAYMLNNETAQQLSSNTFGLRIKGEAKPSLIKYGYSAEIAHQQTAKNSPWDFSGYYLFAELSAQYKSHQIALAHERLSEDNGFAFATSLGNNHLFLGWADIFSSYLNTDGIRDTFITYRGRDAQLRWRVVFHQYNSDSSGATAGHELDIEVAYRFTREWEATFLNSRYYAKEGIEGLPASQTDLSTWTLGVSYHF